MNTRRNVVFAVGAILFGKLSVSIDVRGVTKGRPSLHVYTSRATIIFCDVTVSPSGGVP
jgi:hypothetical protein